MSELVALVDAYRDRHGRPSEASVARAIGVAPQTINSWRNRGVKQMPEPETIHKLAALMRVPLETVVMAAARDAGYLRPKESEQGGLNTPAIDEAG